MDGKEVVITVMPFRFDNMYQYSDIEHMMPGIIHYFFEDNKTPFTELVEETINYSLDDKGAYLLKLSYYENMRDVVGTHLLRLGMEKLIRRMLETHYVHNVDISVKDADLFIEWQVRYGHNNTF